MSTIKLNELATTNISLTDFFAKADNTGLMTKNTISELAAFFTTVGEVGFKGELLIADTPSVDGWWIAGESGTYTNAGGLVVSLANQFVIIVRQTTFSQIEIPLNITFDATPTAGSTNAVTSNGVFDALALKANITDVFDVTTEETITPTWSEFGLSSDGTVNTSSSQSHSDYIDVSELKIITSNETIYRIATYNDALVNQGQIIPTDNKYQVPEDSPVTKVRISMQEDYTTNDSEIYLYLAKTDKEILTRRDADITETNDRQAADETLQNNIDLQGVLDFDWLEFGIGSDGNVNTNASVSHSPFFDVFVGQKFETVGEDLYRIHLYDSDGNTLGEDGFLGGASYTVSNVANVAQIKFSVQEPYDTNTTKIYTNNKKYFENINSLQNARISQNESDISDNADDISDNADNISTNSDAINLNKVDVRAAVQNGLTINGVTEVDYTPYLENVDFDGSGNKSATDPNKLSIVEMPVDHLINYLIYNTVDIDSDKKIVRYDVNGDIISSVSRKDQKNYELRLASDVHFVSITLVSTLSEGVVDYDSIKIYAEADEKTDLTVTHINGFPIEPTSVSNPDIKSTFTGYETNNNVALGIGALYDRFKVTTNNAFHRGFLPTNTAIQNATIFAELLAEGGEINITYPGIYDITDTQIIKSNTTINCGVGVYFRKGLNASSQSARYVLINEGAYTRTYDENITINGFRLICNGYDVGTGGAYSAITGLRGHISFFFVKNLRINNFECLDLLTTNFCIHIAEWENVIIDDITVYGGKDAVHVSTGKTLLIQNGYFKTYDDPIALNAHDYNTSCPTLGNIENVIVRNVYDLDDVTTDGFFARVLAGAWVDWFSGMEVQNGDTVVSSNGKLYRVVMPIDGTLYTSTTEPTHASGTVTLNGIDWLWIQDNTVYSATCKNIVFEDIYLQKQRLTAFSYHFDNDDYSRSYYPNAEIPIVRNVTLNRIFQQNTITTLLTAITPIDAIKISNSDLVYSKLFLKTLTADGLTYDSVPIVMSGNTFNHSGAKTLVSCEAGRTGTFRSNNSIVTDATFNPAWSSLITVIFQDLE